MIDTNQLLNSMALKEKKKNEAGTTAEEDFDENAKIFPQRLMEMLSEPTNADAITWLPHGNAFIIINRQKFANYVLPKYFRKTKYTSFTRKLNRWNFARVTRGPEIGAYYHEFFQQNNEALCTQMYCKNERAKFALSKDSKESKSEPETTKPTEEARSPPMPSSPVTSNRMPVPELPHSPATLPKPMEQSIDPTLQTRAALLGQQPINQSLLHHTFHNPLAMMSPEAGLLYMQHFAAMQHQLQCQQQQQQQQQQHGSNRGLYSNCRASAA